MLSISYKLMRGLAWYSGCIHPLSTRILSESLNVYYNRMSMNSVPMRSKRGFTLIELSIVLVVIGLIVGGVLVGKDLIETSRIRQLGMELQQIKTAITTFRGKYDCLPGDCINATTYFGTNSNGCPNGGGDLLPVFVAKMR